MRSYFVFQFKINPLNGELSSLLLYMKQTYTQYFRNFNLLFFTFVKFVSFTLNKFVIAKLILKFIIPKVQGYLRLKRTTF